MRTFERQARQALLPFLPAIALAAAVAALPIAGPHAWWLCGAPIAEEVVFRAGLQAALRRRLTAHLGDPAARTLAVLLGALAFAAAHAAAGHMAGAWTLLPGLLLGAVYERTGRLAPCVLLHALFNAFWLAFGPLPLP